jgi:hypothetical protein
VRAGLVPASQRLAQFYKRGYFMKRLIATIALAAAVVTVLLSGAVTAAHATPISRANAVRVAKDYLRTSGFSFKGLVEQLEFEGFTASDSRYGASHAGANWWKQAVRVARDYLRTEGFSFRGMVEQLQFEGFTHAQAVYGARTVGL